MKRRLWIVLATVALLAALWCAAASADNLVFTDQPICGALNTENQTYSVAWKTSFLPCRIQVIYKWVRYGNEVDSVVIDLENATSAAGVSAVPASLGGGRIFIRAYYSDEVYRDSDIVTLGPVNGGFTSQPACATLTGSNKVYPITWATDYVPTMVKVMERSSYYGIQTEKTVATLENLTGNTGYYETLGNDGGKRYFIRAYYGRDAWHDSDDFIVGPADPRFTVQPQCGTLNAADRTYPLTWQTSFRPVKTAVMKKTMYLGYEVNQTVATLEDIEGFNGSWPVPGDEGGEKYFIRAYYGGKDVYVDSTPVILGPSNPAFTVQPKGKVLDTVDNTYRITWQTDFVPTEIKIYAWDGFYDSYVTGMTENLGMNGSCPVPASCGGGKLLVRAYYGKNAWKDSGYFKPGPVDGRFTMQPVVGSLNTETNTYPITWYTDFVPTEVIIKADYELSGSGEILEWQDSGLGTRGTWNAPAKYLGKRVRIWAYYGDTAYRDSQPFTVTPNSVPITLNAWGGSVNPGFLRTASDGKPGTLPVPVREGCVFTGWYTDSTGGRKVGPDSVFTEATTLYARWIGMPAFKTQPKSGTVYPWQPLQLTWRTDRVPDRVEIGQGTGNRWTKEADVTADPAEKMSWSLAYTDAFNADDWTVRAYYGDAGQYVESKPFSVRRATAYTCGDQVTAVFSGGTLTISGTGAMYDYGTTASTLAPWHDIWEQITEVKIEDGVTVIGRYAFYECRNVTNVYVPASVTGVRFCAFSVCTSVKWAVYGGFPEQWTAVSWDAGNTKLKDASVSWIYRKEKISGSNITWTVMGETGRLVISGSGAMPNSSPWHSYAPYLHEICVEGDVTAISNEAFRDCDAVTEVHLPGTLETIGTYAFGDCTALTDVFYDGIRTDFDQINIQAGNDPLTADTVTLHMGSVSGRLTVDLNWYLNDAGVLSIVFDGMDAEEMEIPDYSDQNSPGWQNYADQIREIRIDDGVTRIGNMAFYELTGVRRVEIPDTVTSIGDFAFIYCAALQEITIPDSVTAIGQYAFGECESLQKAVLPEGLETIRTACFEYCNSLNHIIIPETVHTIEASAFAPCTALANGGDVFFGGSRGAWLMISKGSNNAALDTAKIHYTPEEPFVDATFPDDELRSLVSASIDTDGDGWFSEEEVSRAVSLCMEDADGLTSLEGIETLSALRSLRVNGAQGLTDADLRKNKNLTDVDLSSNGLTGLQTEGLAALAVLRVSGNALEELDVSGLALAELRCDGNPLTTLTLGSQSALKKLDCSGSSLAELNIHDCPYLIEAYYGTADTSHEGYDVYTSGSCELQVDKGTQITVGTFEINFYSYSTPFLHVSTVTGADGRVADLPVPESAGYEFDHWYYLSDEGTVTVDADTRYVRKTSVYAKWTPVPHTITVIGGTAGADEECNLTYIEIAADEKSGATFSRWTVESGGVTIQDAASASTWFIMGAEDVVIRAEFDYGGFAKQPECVINEPNKLPEGPFVYSWSLPFTPYRTEILQNGSLIDTLEDGADSRVFTPSEDEYTVRAWYDETGWVDSEPFRVELCTITFKFGYGDTYGPYTAQVPAGAVYVLPKCIFHPPVGRSGGWLGRFEGWRLADGDNVPVYRIGTTVTVTPGMMLKAKWQEEGASYVITFYSNGGEMNTVTKTWPFLVYGEPEPGTLPNWDGRGPEGYKDQLYWRTLEHLDEIYVKPSWAETSQNQGYYNYGSALPGQTYYKPQFGETNWVAAYPVWGNRYTVNFDANGAADTGMYHMSYEILKVEMGKTMDYTVPECRFRPLDGYTFKGWQLGDAIFQPGDVIQTVISDLNFKAIWYNEEEECFCLCGLTGGEPFGCGTDAENREYRFTEAGEGTWKRLVRFEQDSFVAVKHYNGYYGDECAWYSAVTQTEAGTVLGNFGATTDPDAMVAVPGGITCALVLTDNGNGSYTLSVEEAVEYSICSDFTGWEETLLEYNGTTGLYEYSTELEPSSWSFRYDFQIFVNGTEYTLAEPVYDAVYEGTLIPVQYEDENGDTDYRDIIALYVSGTGTYTIALDPDSLTLTVTNDLETPGAFVAVDEWAVYRMTDPASGESGGEGDEGGPVKPHIFSSGTTLWAGAYLNGGENPFRIISGGSFYGADSIVLATAENQLTAGVTGQITLGEEEGDRYDFYYNPESHKLFVQKRPYTSSLRLCAWYEDENGENGTALTEPWQSDDDEETGFILDPLETQYVEGDPVTVTASAIPGYRFVRWEEGYVYHWWGSDDTEGYTLERYGDEPFSTQATLTFDISEHESLVAVYAEGDWTEVAVLFDSMGGTDVDPQSLEAGNTAQEPNIPMKTGAYFGGWYTDENCAEEDLFDFATPVTADLTLFAKWIVPEPAGFLKLPASLAVIEAEAFSGVSAEAVIIPTTVTAIEGDPFAGSSVQYIYGYSDVAKAFADAHPDYIFIPVDDSWTPGD